MKLIRTHTQRDSTINSERDSLPFPEGGVFGRTDEAHERACSAPAHTGYTADIEGVLDEMQRRVDTLSDELDRLFRLPVMDDDEPRPAA